MNSKIILVIEIIIIAALLAAIFLFDTKTTLGKVELGITMAVTFTIIYFLDNMREKASETEQPADQTTASFTSATSPQTPLSSQTPPSQQTSTTTFPSTSAQNTTNQSTTTKTSNSPSPQTPIKR